MGLLALVVVALENTVGAQPLKPPNSSEQALRDAAFDDQIETVRSILDKNAKPDARDPDGRTALMMAAFNGHTDTARLLINHGAKVNVLDGAGRTALMYTASGPYPETARLLLEIGADPNHRDTEEGQSQRASEEDAVAEIESNSFSL